ncbi:lytic transglycosylase domain-containing protein [Tabrizicola oligotrophica]|uniref:Lytic transglycosylase domain-containing protein n=1 Tax=Tabrizicola oligotrophica TaxID=2710650 RepID=A0A6M0QS62_9RHOB|nr:lytic transglycosylase domain-containing protein [Tabrizicola oligotrophica]NEY90266.1 lytic transglycosylase domain-containing protein [Tabrizicola oligotrophica]
MKRLALMIPVLAAMALPAHAGPTEDALREGLRLASGKDWANASAAVAGVGGGAADLVEWHRLRGGDEAARLGDYEAFLARHPDWPGLALLREKGEVAVARSTDPARVIAYFGAAKPATGEGAVALVKALMQSARPGEAEAEAHRAWAVLKFEADEEAALLDLQGEAMAVAHEVRLDNLLWDGKRTAEALRMVPRVSAGWQALAKARLALRADKAGASALIDAVPAALKDDPGLAYERFLWRMRRDNYPDATELLLERSDSPARLGRPEAWAERRALLARWLMRNGQESTAYRLAARHHLKEGSDRADLEFLAGFIALRKLGDADTALRHFADLKAGVKTPISLSRADYWTGRALEAKGDATGAQAAYQSAAQYQTAYYGQLAAEKLGLSLDPALIAVGEPARGYKTAAFAGSSVLAAARLAEDVGDTNLAKRFFLHLAESQDRAGLEALSDLALLLEDPHIALVVAKQAAEKGWILPRAYYPVPDMVPDNLAVSRALALAISRRESEFDPAARSHANAMGLMQLLPETAGRMAKGMGLAHETRQLTSDPAHNATLGAAYLAKMVEEFGPSVAMVASGYNAGPGRPRKWVAEFGDPRSGDPVDWVETIPFAETRTYVMRVSESLVIYRQRLKGQAGPVRLTAELTGQ